jgi:hypothetical protein
MNPRHALIFAAAECCMEPNEFVSALVAAHIQLRPKWNASVYADLRDIGGAVRQIAAMVPDMGPLAVGRLLELVRALDRRLDVMTEDRADYWHGAPEICNSRFCSPSANPILLCPQRRIIGQNPKLLRGARCRRCQ